ncbi:uncharacterized protein LOC112461458, partial [Temnothorax curvispinosus]|uniref:Uncharacterized protein LOC112461458 n=1 Tax=Temnothorax curvispinosus TaxID=300111 RepID=A0A6J1QJ78_9HYME
ASRAYRTVSHAAATVLAGLLQLELVTACHAEVYRRTRLLQIPRGRQWDKASRVIKLQAETVMVGKWREYLANRTVTKYGRRTVDAVLPHLDAWLDGRRHGLTFRATQVLTGHGCFGKYLCRIWKKADTRCHHCDEVLDMA